MKKMGRIVVLVSLGSFAVGLAGGILIGKARGIPFVANREQWTIGIYAGDSPFDLSSPFWTWSPVLRAEGVTDVPAKFVADPLLLKDESTR